MIFKVLTEEEDKFNKAIDQGLSILGEMEAEMAEKGEKVLSGENAFMLYDTYGFPVDLTKEILEEKNLSVDEDGFAACMKKQKETARAARKTTNYMGADVTVYQSIDPSVTTEFVGYDRLTHQSEGFAGLFSTLYICISLPFTIIWKIYRRVAKGIPIMK